jgi:hypothetical protein
LRGSPTENGREKEREFNVSSSDLLEKLLRFVNFEKEEEKLMLISGNNFYWSFSGLF